MPRTTKIKRVPFSFSLLVSQAHNGITHQFSRFTIEGWAKKKGRRKIADIDRIFIDNKELKGDLEALQGIDSIEEAAEIHVEQIFKRA